VLAQGGSATASQIADEITSADAPFRATPFAFPRNELEHGRLSERTGSDVTG
jgi:hypothetical protein